MRSPWNKPLTLHPSVSFLETSSSASPHSKKTRKAFGFLRLQKLENKERTTTTNQTSRTDNQQINIMSSSSSDQQQQQELQDVVVHTNNYHTTNNNNNNSNKTSKATTTKTTKTTRKNTKKSSSSSPPRLNNNNHNNHLNEYGHDIQQHQQQQYSDMYVDDIDIDDDGDDEDGIGFVYNDEEIHATLLNFGPQRQSLGIENLDDFFTQVYKYYVSKGFWTWFTQKFLKLCTILFMISLTTLLTIFVDWSAIWNCRDQECASVQVIRTGVLQKKVTFNWFHRASIVFHVGVLFYWLYLCYGWMRMVSSMYRIKQFFNVHLNVSENELQTLEWEEIVQKMINLQNEQGTRIHVMKELNAFDIMSRIMRRENFLIAFLNREVLNLRVPLHYLVPFYRKKYGILSQSLLWNLKYIIDYMFDADFKVKERIIQDPDRLRKQFIWLGVLNMIASPFIFFYVLVYTVFKYSVDIRNSPMALLERRWSLLAKWKFREFNELPHLFERRLKRSYGPARSYTEQFPDYFLSTIAKSVMFVASSLVATIVLLSSIKNPLLLYVNIFHQNLFWWLTMLLLVWAHAKSMVIDELRIFEPKERLSDVCSIIHYYPDKWKELGHHLEVKQEFDQFFQFSFEELIQELSSILITPIILCFSLPNSAEQIVKFMDEITVDAEGVGHVCGFATFNFNRFGSTTMNSASSDQMQRSLQDKMEASYLNFKAHYPTWTPPTEHGAAQFEQKLSASIMNMETSKRQSVGDGEGKQKPCPPVSTPPTTTVTAATSTTPPTTAATATTTTESVLHQTNTETTSVMDESINVLDQAPSILEASSQIGASQMSRVPAHMLESKDYFHMLDSLSQTWRFR